MARRIAGITIEIGGDTTQLNKALKGVDSQLSQTQRNLRDVGKLLKLDPKNTELLTQKQKYLTDAIDNTKKRLADLKTASEQAAKSAKNYDAWKAKFDPIQEALKETRQKSEDLKKQLEKLEQGGKIDTDEYRKLQGELKETDEQAKRLKEEGERVSEEYGKPISPEKFDALQREIVETEQELKSLQDDMKGFGSITQQKLNAVGEQLKQTGEKIKNTGEKIAGVGSNMTRYLTAPILGVGTAAVKLTADFDSQMSKVSAISGATGKDFDVLRDKAREMGEKTKFSATESAQAFEYMAMAGWKPKEMLEGISGIMNLAAASGEELATTSDIVTDNLTAFGQSADQAGRLANIMAAAASNSNTNVAMMGETFKDAAATAGGMGYSMEDTAIATGLMADAGIKASRSGTAIRNILLRMSKPTKESAMAMDRLGLSLTDSDGKMKSLHEIMDDIRSGFGDILMPEAEFKEQLDKLNAALEDGSITQAKYDSQLEELTMQAYGAEGAEKARAAAMLAGKPAMAGLLAIVSASPEKYKQLTEAVYNSSEEIDGFSGTAERMAATMNDNLNGQLTILMSQLQELAISFGDLLVPVLRDAVSWIQGVVDKLNGMDEGTRKTILTIAGVIAVVGPVLLVVGKISVAIGSIINLVGILLPVIGSVGSVLFGSIIPAVGGLLAAAAPLIPIIAAIVAVVWTVVAAIKHWGEITASVQEAFVKNGGGLKGAVAAVLAGIAGIWKASFDELDKLTGGKLGQIVKLIDQHLGWAKALFKGWKDGVVLVGGSALEAVQENLNRIAKAFKDNGGGIKGTVAALATALKGQFTVVLSFIDKLTGGKLTDIKNKFRMAFTDVARTVVGKFIYIKDGIKDKLDSAYNTIHNIVERIKSIFNFRIRLPKPEIPTPHVTWTNYGTFSLPSIEWYRKAYDNAMLFQSPTVLATGAGLKGFGDGPGGEIVMGLNKLRELVGSGGETTYTATFNIYTQPGQDNRQIARMVQDQFVRWQRQKEAAKV